METAKRCDLFSQAWGTVWHPDPSNLGLALEQLHLSHLGLSNRVIDTLQNVRAASTRSQQGYKWGFSDVVSASSFPGFACSSSSFCYPCT
ncbi:UNVERIFIED_CONTAM: hypothetical protein FKN15_059216 [Acipenser sinensis]